MQYKDQITIMTGTGNPRELNQLAVTITFQKDVHVSVSGESHSTTLLDFAMRYALYGALTAIFLMVMALIVKLMWNCDDGDEANGAVAAATENSRLLLSKDEAAISSYGTTRKGLESGGSSSSSEDFYDGKICLICYDDQRNCFFIPCGHCVACHTCAHRIISEESKSCPICRGIVDKIRKLHIV